MSEDLYLVGSMGNVDPGSTVSFVSVCQRSLILPSRGFGLRDWVEDTALKKNQTIDVVFEIDSVATIRDLVEGGLGWTILPFAAVQQAVQSKRLLASQIISPRVPRTLHLAHASSHVDNNAARAVRGIIDRVIAGSIRASQGRLSAP